MKKYRIPVLILLLLLLAVSIGAPLVQQANHRNYVALSIRLYIWCSSSSAEIQSCADFADRWDRDDTVAACNRLNPDLDSPFRDCLTAEGIAPR